MSLLIAIQENTTHFHGLVRTRGSGSSVVWWPLLDLGSSPCVVPPLPKTLKGQELRLMDPGGEPQAMLMFSVMA